MSNLNEQLEDIVQRRKKLTEIVERLKGRLEQAQANLEEVENECRVKKIDPDKIDEVIKALESKYQELISGLITDTEAAEKKLEPFISGSVSS